MDNENTTRLILQGIKLAKDLEANLPNLANQPDSMSTSCEEIIRVFSSVRERLSCLRPHSLTMIHDPPQRSASSGGDGNIQDWLMRSTSSQALDLFRAQVLGEQAAAPPPFQAHGEAVEGSTQSGGEEVQHMPVSDSSRGPSSSQSQRRRGDETDRTTVNVLAPQMGNLDMPPEDGYTWRKYGQKDILGSKFPRAYYRCTHQKLYNCPAKKQVQRLDDNPHMFKVTYRYHHTCHMSATAPSAPPPPPPPPAVGDVLQQQGTTTHQQPQSQPPPGGGASSGYWLSMDIEPKPSEGTSTFHHDMQMHRDFGNFAASSVASTSNVAPGSDGAGPSTSSRYGRDVDFSSQLVVDLADAMFNSGSSSNNSMDFIFHTMNEK